MGFALQNAGLISYVFSTSAKSKLYTEEQKFSKNKFVLLSEEKIEKCKAKFEKQIFNNTCICGKIGKMCIRIVQQQLKETWMAKKMEDNLKSKYTTDGWYSKW